MKVIKKGFNYSQDGYGNRLVYHLQGCNMHCPWCANPEGMEPKGSWIEEHNGKKLSYQEVSVETMVKEAVSCKAMFFENGGVTVTGGEPTLQLDEVKKLFMALKEQNISTAMETNGTHPRLEELFPFLDLLVMDLKHMDGKKHRDATGLGNEAVLKNIRKAAREVKELWIRTPLIGGFNDDCKDIQRYVEFYKSLPMERVKLELLVYHEYGKEKWLKCGKQYTIENGFVKEATREAFECAYRKAGFTVIRT